MNLRINTLVSFSLAFALAGCQSYRRAPLDFAASDSDWSARDPASEALVSYARRAAGNAGETRPSYDPSDGLSLAEAEVVALFFNPQLRVARVKANVARAGAAEAGRWEDPELGVDAERILASVAEPWVLVGSVAVTIPVSGRLGAEKDRAAADADVARLRVLVEERTALAELRDEWLQWSAARERVALTSAALADLRDLAAAAEKLRQAGELDPADARRFVIERATQESRLAALEAEARDRELGLRARMGLKPGAPVGLVPGLDIATVSTDGGDGPAALARSSPRLRLAGAEYEAAEQALRLEVRKQYPDLGLHGGYGTDEGDERLVFGGSVPLTVWNGNRRAIAEARAGRDAARASADAEYEALVSALARARDRAGAAARRLEFVRREVAPLGEQQLADVRRLGRLGDFNSVVVLEAARSAHEARLELIAARLEASQANNRLNSLAEGSNPEVRP